jgi:hypothetical protein
MSEQTQRPFQYMIDIGVPREEVNWLTLVASTPAVQLAAEVRARIKQIQDQAYRKLIEASVFTDHALQ